MILKIVAITLAIPLKLLFISVFNYLFLLLICITWKFYIKVKPKEYLYSCCKLSLLTIFEKFYPTSQFSSIELFASVDPIANFDMFFIMFYCSLSKENTSKCAPDLSNKCLFYYMFLS